MNLNMYKSYISQSGSDRKAACAADREATRAV